MNLLKDFRDPELARKLSASRPVILSGGLKPESVAEATAPLEVGEETTILEGSMRGLKVKVIKLMPSQERVAVLMEMMGTLVEAEFSSDALEHRMKHPMAAEE